MDSLHYQQCLANGCSPRLADMLASRQPPMSNTDREFLEGRGGCYDQFKGNQFLGNFYGGVAKEAGVDTTGKVYVSGLAAYPGDPQAWVSGRGDVQRVLEERGWGSDGAVKVKPVAQEPAKLGIAPDLIDDEVERVLDAHPEPQCVDVGELRDQITEARKPYWAE